MKIFFAILSSVSFLFAFCRTPKNRLFTFSELCEHAKKKDAAYLSWYKDSLEGNWNSKWKLKDAHVDTTDIDVTYTDRPETVKEKEITCTLDWELKTDSCIEKRHEVYYPEKGKDPEIELKFLRNDTLFASGQVVRVSEERKIWMYRIFMIENPAVNDHVYKMHVYEMWENGSLTCTYACKSFDTWHSRYNGNEVEVELSSHYPITSSGKCDYVTVLQ